MFVLDSKLEADTFFISDFKLSSLLLMNDANYLWLILAPKREGLTEIIDLSFDEQIGLLHEINILSEILKKDFRADKLNIGALGNMVSQLHIHVIARKRDDVTFPKPVWGNAPAKPYEKKQAQDLISKIKELLPKND